jgi:hypothetical protein
MDFPFESFYLQLRGILDEGRVEKSVLVLKGPNPVDSRPKYFH